MPGTAELVLLCSLALPDSARGIVSVAGRPVFQRGGALSLELAAQKPGDGWPDALLLRLEDGRSIDAAVAWVCTTPPPARRRWSDEPGDLAVRAIRADDSTGGAASGGAPYAVARIPIDWEGDFSIVDPRDGSVSAMVRPLWIDAAPSLVRSDDDTGAAIEGVARAPLVKREDAALPDPDSPFAHWRWALLADRREVAAPDPAGDELERLVAEHGAQMWRIGLARVATQSPGVAAACRELLTNVCRDGEREIAAWMTEPAQVGALLTLLLDFNRRDRAVMESALGWVESRDALTLWIEQEQGGAVTLVFVNPLVEAVDLAMRWTSAKAEPLGRTLPGVETTRVHVARPAELADDSLGRADIKGVPLPLSISGARFRREILVGRARDEAKPPGFPLPLFRPVLRLAEARSGAQRGADPSRVTAGVLRRVNRRWELFIECARPPAPTEEGSDVAAPAEQSSTESSAKTQTGPPIGREAITLLLGPREAPTTILCVPEEGEPWLPRGDRPVDLAVHRRSLPAIWRCRIVLPDAWVSEIPGDLLLLALARTHAGDEAIETAGVPQPPWDVRPAPLAIDLSRWDE